jgi:2-polyprenyl-3-methyl-5-hydroxy-6-metoxy-1,4-benzoquinol methylase
VPINAHGLNPDSLERLVPDDLSENEATGRDTLRLHLERYLFAKSNLTSGSVLDIACGVGYGTPLLAENPQTSNALGVDISAASIQYALQRYGNPRVSYTCCDAMHFSPGRQFGNIVSLETVEHVDDPKAFLAHLVSLLQPGGRLIASVPITPSVDANPHHRSNFSQKSFLLLGEAVGLRFLTSMNQIQHFSPVAMGMRSEARTAGLRRNLGSFYLKHPSHFALRLWSTLRDGFVNKYLTVVWQR